MKIYNRSNQEILDITPDDSSQRVAELRSDDTVTLNFSLPQYTEIPAGAWIEFEERIYSVERPGDVTIRHSQNFEYSVKFESTAARLKYVIVRDQSNEHSIDFSFTGKLQDHVELIALNMSKRDSDHPWTIESLLQSDEEKAIHYERMTCRDAIDLIADTFETEWEVSENYISVEKIEYFQNEPLELSYGKGNGLRPGITKKPYGDRPPTKTLCAEGSEKNVSVGTYGAKRLHMPAVHGGFLVSFDGEHFGWETGYNASTAQHFYIDDDGLSVIRTAQAALPDFRLWPGESEEAKLYDDIYPKRESAATLVTRTLDSEGNPLYAITDDTIPAALDFSQSVIQGETLRVTFQSGILVGRTFDVQYQHNSTPDFPARTFKLVPADIDGIKMPNDTWLPTQGDRYAVFNMALPQAYIRDDATHTGAEWELLKEAVKYMYENHEESVYTAEIDQIWSDARWNTIGQKMRPGTWCKITDPSVQQTPYMARITKIVQTVNNPKKPTITLSDKPEKPGNRRNAAISNSNAAIESEARYSATALERNALANSIGAPLAVQTFYAATATQTSPAADQITETEMPAMNSTTAKYMWKKTVTTYANGTTGTQVDLAAVNGDSANAAYNELGAMDGGTLELTPSTDKSTYVTMMMATKDGNIKLMRDTRSHLYVFAENTGSEQRTITVTQPRGYTNLSTNTYTLEPGESVEIRVMALASNKRMTITATKNTK